VTQRSLPLLHLPALYYKRNYYIHVHVYLLVGVNVCLVIGLTVMHIENWVTKAINTGINCCPGVVGLFYQTV